jgi:hemolysin activation/secretion protein
LIHSDGSDYARLAYSLPVGYNGWRVGASGSTLKYKLIAADFIAMNGKGSSSTLGLDASYPIIRTRTKNLYVSFNYDQKSFINQANLATSSNYNINEFSAGLSGNLFDNLGGGGVNSASVTFIQGRVALGTLDIAENAALNGNFNKTRYNLSRQQMVTDDVTLYGALSGQQTNKTLDSSEKFYLGGSSGVRAYPVSEGAGSSGNLINLEVRYKLPQNFNFVGFYDTGSIRNYDGSKSYSLSGAGLTLGWQAANGLTVKGTWARRIGNNPNPMANGNDQDGSLVKDRTWVQANLTF